MAKPENNSPLQEENKALSKPLGLKRPLSWLLALPIFLAFLVLPWLAVEHPELLGGSKTATTSPATTQSKIAGEAGDKSNQHPGFYQDVRLERKKTAHSLDSVWNPGPLDSVHQNWEGDCQACHVGNFSRVQDQSCMDCHGGMGLHVSEDAVAETNFTEDRCASCHRDHKGLESLATQNKHYVGSDCAACHQNIKASAPKTETLNVSRFDGDDHPQFRITLRSDNDPADMRRVRLKAGEMLTEKTTLKFPHDVHLDPKGIEGKEKVVVMECNDCHTPADTKTNFEPIVMETHCQDCHSLAFEPALPDREVPHGNSGEALDTIVEFYSYLSQNPQLREKVRQGRAAIAARPGDDKKRSNFGNLDGKPLAQAQFAAKDLFENRACAVCHDVYISDKMPEKMTSGSVLPQYAVADIQPGHTFMPMAKFEHSAHDFTDCTACHAAPKSEEASDVLMPEIAVCQDCHTGEKASLQKVESDCGLCHGYHMHEPRMATQEPQKTASSN